MRIVYYQPKTLEKFKFSNLILTTSVLSCLTFSEDLFPGTFSSS